MTELEVYNSALTLLSVPPMTATDDPTTEGDLMRHWYPLERDRILATGYFDFSNENHVLSAVNEVVDLGTVVPGDNPFPPEDGYPDVVGSHFTTPGGPGWGYEFIMRPPEGALRINFIYRDNTLDPNARYDEWEQTEDVIFANQDPLYASVAMQRTDLTMWPPLALEALEYALARKTCMPLKRDMKLHAQMNAMYTEAFYKAVGMDWGKLRTRSDGRQSAVVRRRYSLGRGGYR